MHEAITLRIRMPANEIKPSRARDRAMPKRTRKVKRHEIVEKTEISKACFVPPTFRNPTLQV